MKYRFPIDIRVYRKTRVLPFGKTSLLHRTTAILGDTEMPFANRRVPVRNKPCGFVPAYKNRLVNWLKFIGTSDKEERAMLATTSPVLQMLNEQLDIMTLSPIERQLYESRMKLKSDIVTLSETQYHAGWEEGKLETAKNLLNIGISVANIVKATGLTEQEIAQLEY